MPTRRIIAIETAVTLALWLALACLGRSQLFRDPGTFWHTVLGEQILDQRGPVRVDPFSFTRPGAPYVDYEWLAEAAMGALYRLGGWDALLLATAFLLAWTFSRGFSRLVRAGLHPLLALLLLGLALAASSHQFHVRPLIVSMALLLWSFSLLVDVESGRVPARRLLWLIPAFIAWANAHGGVLAGIGTVGLVCGGWALAAVWPSLACRFGVRPLPGRSVWLAVLVAAGCVAAVLVNPFGTAMPRIWLEIMALPLPQLIQEHAPMDLRQPYAWCTLALAGIYLAALAGVMLNKTSPAGRVRVVWFLPVVWFVLALMRVRNAPLMALTVLVALADLLPHCRWAGWLSSRDLFQPAGTRPCAADRRIDWSWLGKVASPMSVESPRESPPPAVSADILRQNRSSAALASIIPVSLLVVFLAIQAAGAHIPVVGRGWARWDESRWPLALVPELQGLQADPLCGGRIFNDMLLGGFVIYQAPGLRVFIDDRCDFYGRTFLLDYEQARTQHPETLAAWQRQYGFRYALVVPQSPLDVWLQQARDWAAVARCEAGVLYRLQD